MTDIEERSKRVALYMIAHQSTVRQAAKDLGVGKSTVYKDIAERLQNVNPMLYEQVEKLLMKNKAERSLRGGMATKAKYTKKK